jgi:hypothetical protein
MNPYHYNDNLKLYVNYTFCFCDDHLYWAWPNKGV